MWVSQHGKTQPRELIIGLLDRGDLLRRYMREAERPHDARRREGQNQQRIENASYGEAGHVGRGNECLEEVGLPPLGVLLVLRCVC